MDLYQEAIDRFLKIFQEVSRKKLTEPTAFTLATADHRGRPSSRVLLLKGCDEKGFVFYTNLKSRKGRDLSENPWVSLTFFWDPLDFQIRVEGKAAFVSNTEADEYWATRPRDSQIGAWASLQSSELESRGTFLKRIAQYALKFGTRPVPRPPHWSGVRVSPERIEFWKRKPFRLHERIVYVKSGRGWTKKLLYP